MMEEHSTPRLRPVISVALSILAIFIGFAVVGQLIGMMVGSALYEGTFVEFTEEFQPLEMKESLRLPLMAIQAGAGLGLFLIPWLHLRFIEKMEVGRQFGSITIKAAGLAAAATILMMLPNSVIIEWNSNLVFPGELDPWIRERENMAEAMTKFLTSFRGPGDFLLGFLLIAVLPAISEEFAFRGMLQPALNRATGNMHIAVWVTAILFSAFHFQFLGFVPRLMLGVLFGYLLAWSGRLWLPIIAHFVNNGLMVILLYLHQLGYIDINPESTEAAPLLAVVPATILLVFALRTFKKISTPTASGS